MYHDSNKERDGFTLIELMLAMTFVSILLVAIAMLTIQVSNMYTRGVTLRQVNEAGLEISSDLQRSLRQASDVKLTSTQQQVSNSYVPQDIGGRLCLGDFSYVWNTAKALSEPSSESRLNKISADASATPPGSIRFVKVLDRGKQLCRSIVNAGTTSYPNVDPENQPIDMLLAGDRDLAVHSMTVRPTVDGLAMIELTIGTRDQSIIDTAGTCLPPSNLASNQEYCAVNKFVIVTRTGN